MEIPIPQSLIHHFEMVYINESSLGSDVSNRILKYFPKEKIKIVREEPWLTSKGELSAADFNRSKKNIYLTPFPGHFFRRCPGATQKKTLTCCNYYVLNLGSQCNMNCSYCYLQSYLNSRIMKIYTNIDQALLELEEMASQHPDLPYRVGTGEVIDSLSLDEITLYSRALINFFKKYPRWTLEFKTKSDRVDQFLDLGIKWPQEFSNKTETSENSFNQTVTSTKNIVVSWSINPPVVINSEEHGTARFEERIAAAKKCVHAGFSLAFHIDPIIWHDDWKENYSFLVKTLCDHFSPEQVSVISLGTLRFQPEQRHMMRERFGMKSLVTSAEMFPSEGGKMRYDAGLRNEMFQFVLNEFRQRDSRWNIFLCMETPETWISSFEKTPMQVEGLKNFFRPLPKVEKDSFKNIIS